jgi:hypothetical protein
VLRRGFSHKRFRGCPSVRVHFEVSFTLIIVLMPFASVCPMIPDTRHMDQPNNPLAPWTASRSAKEKNIVQRAVTALLDQLAPERVLKRDDKLRGSVEQHRTPKGCVLQAPNAAVSVSWFVDAGKQAPLGELHVIVWSGTVSRRGAAANPEGAKVVKELVLRPIEAPVDDCVWRAMDGTEYDTAALAARCVALLAEQVDKAVKV